MNINGAVDFSKRGTRHFEFALATSKRGLKKSSTIMATYVGGLHGEVSSSFYRRPFTTTKASSVSANMGPTTMPTFSKASEGLEGVPVRTFTTIKNIQGAIDWL